MANSPARSVIDVGSVIDKYVIEALIGRGGMGAVFVARHRTLTDKRVAIKILHAEIHDPDILARFKREAQIATRINHPNIVEVHDFDVTPDGVPFLVLEYLEGQTLAQRLASGPIPLDQVMSIVRQIGSALAAAHREGIVHRDLKPQNIFLVPTEIDGRMVEVAKVLDFGISKWRGSETVKTQESALLGTPQYMAPEQATGRHERVDERTDVFALGSIVYEMLCGHPAFTGASIPEVVFKVVYEQPAPIASEVPATVATAIRQAMAKEAGERYATVSSFVEALTGTALTNFRPSTVTRPGGEGFASGSKKISNPEALGDTMGSGDYGSAPPAVTPLPVAGPPVRGSAPTVDSMAAKDVGLAATSDALPVARAKKPVWWVAGAVAAIGATIVIMYFVMRKPEREPRPRDREPEHEREVAQRPRHEPPVPPAKIAVVTPDAGVIAPPPTPAKDVPKDPKKQVKKAPVVDEGAGAATGVAPDEVDSVKETLQAALAALDAGELDHADRLANTAINLGGAQQRAKGAMIKGLVACDKRDVEQANTQLGQLGGYPKLRQRVVNRCKTKGLDGVR